MAFELIKLFKSTSPVYQSGNYGLFKLSTESSSGGGDASSKVYGVSGLYSSDAVLTRTDDAVGMTYTVDTATGIITSDFDNVFPYNQMTRETDELGNVLVNVPSMWFRVGVDSSNRITDIAVSSEKGDIGNWYQTRAFKYGAYLGSLNGTTRIMSSSGMNVATQKTIGNIRTYIANNGAGYHLADLYSRTVLTFLWLIEMATKNSESVMLGDNYRSGDSTPRVTGSTDTIASSSGYVLSTRVTKWRNIEEFIHGRASEFVDGVYGQSNGIWYVTSDYTKYGNGTSDKNKLGFTSITSSGRLLSLGWDSNNPFLVLPKEADNSTDYSQYFCDRFSAGHKNYPCMVYSGRGDTSNTNSEYGLFYYGNCGISETTANLAGRLVYTPTA